MIDENCLISKLLPSYELVTQHREKIISGRIFGSAEYYEGYAEAIDDVIHYLKSRIDNPNSISCINCRNTKKKG